MTDIPADRRWHILYGDATGGGHPWPGHPGKTPFPRDWSAEQILQAISEVASDPTSVRSEGRFGRLVIIGLRGGIKIRVIVDPDGTVVTGHSINVPEEP